MEDTDLLKVKIEKAKAQLSKDTLNAISAVPWQAEILKMRETKGYSFEQLGDLETETELLLCGLLSPEDYPRELENRMRITGEQANDLVKEMNDKVFSKIKEELIKMSAIKDVPQKPEREEVQRQDPPNLVTTDNQILKSAGIEILNGNEKIPVPEKLELSAKPAATTTVNPAPHIIMTDKLAGPVQTTAVKTDHSVENLTKAPEEAPKQAETKKYTVDPYREMPE
jgi:hypothetical protein